MSHSSSVIKAQLAYAKTRAKEQGQRWTETRENVFEEILRQKKPMSAYQIIHSLSNRTGRDIKPASVYRSLESLTRLGLIVRVVSLNAFMACQHPEEFHQHVFLVCQKCGSTDELADHVVNKNLTLDASHHGFKIDHQVLELQGSCRDCQN